MMKRDECLQVLSRHYPDQVVVPAYQAPFEWMVICLSDLPCLPTGAMGQASSHALGLALARPDKAVWVLDGDGSLLMNLGSLVTIASVAPENFHHFLCHNGVYEANGSHPIPGQDIVDFPGLARSAGYPHCHRFDDLDDFRSRIGDVLGLDGPVFIELIVEQGAVYPQDYVQLHSAERRARFRAAFNPPA